MTRSRSRIRSTICLVPLALLTACANHTGSLLSVQTVLEHRAMWEAQGLTSYSYTYEFWAFNRFAGQPLRLEVRADTVRSVVVVATGEVVDPRYFPTINSLFERALAAARDGSLTTVTFDRQRGYPTGLGYAAVPDALSSERASALQPL